MKKENDKDDKKSDKQEKEGDKKALFTQRLLAFILDFFLISFVASLLSTPFVDVDQYEALSKEATKIETDLVEGKIDVETYTLQYADVSYSMARNNGVLSIITICLEILCSFSNI